MNKTRQPTLRLQFDYGTQHWDFAYITIFYLQLMKLVPALLENNTSKLNSFEQGGILQMIGEVEKARVHKLKIHMDPVQSFELIRNVDEFSSLMVQTDGPDFLEDFILKLNEKFEKYSCSIELEKMYLPFASKLIKTFKDNYSKTENGRYILKLTWPDKDPVPCP